MSGSMSIGIVKSSFTLVPVCHKTSVFHAFSEWVVGWYANSLAVIAKSCSAEELVWISIYVLHQSCGSLLPGSSWESGPQTWLFAFAPNLWVSLALYGFVLRFRTLRSWSLISMTTWREAAIVLCHYLLLMTPWAQRVSASLKMLLPAIQLALAAVTKVKWIETRDLPMNMGTCFVKAVYLCAVFKFPLQPKVNTIVHLLFSLLLRWNRISKLEITPLIENALYLMSTSLSLPPLLGSLSILRCVKYSFCDSIAAEL